MGTLESVEELIDRGLLPIPSEGIRALRTAAAPGPVSFDRIEGMLLGLAIGDALGNTSEGQTPHTRRAHHGEVRDYLPNRHADGRRVGLPSDDTQLAFWTLESLLDHGRILPEELARTFASREIFGIGGTVRAFRAAHQAGAPWYLAAQRSAGNGAVMRIAPVVLPDLGHPSPDLWGNAVLAGAVTHNDPSSIAACLALAGMLREALAMPRPPAPEWWLDAYCRRARLLEGETQLVSRHPTRAYTGPIWRLIDTDARRALAEALPVIEACDRWYSGAFLLETMPSALYILARHADDPEQAIIRAVNDTKDNDTVAAIVGAAGGALHGRRALPER